MTIAIIPPTGTASLQKWIMTLHATISNGTRAASKTKKFHPAATPKASSTKRPANRMKGEEMGRKVTISAIPKFGIRLISALGHLWNVVLLVNEDALVVSRWEVLLGENQTWEVSLTVTARITVHPGVVSRHKPEVRLWATYITRTQGTATRGRRSSILGQFAHRGQFQLYLQYQ